MKKETFPEFVRKQLKGGKVKHDEQLCGAYIKKHYWSFTMFPNINNISVIGKRYETCRKQLWCMRDRKEIQEIEDMRETRENHSARIYLKLTNVKKT